jgi:hypothetical protein
MAPLTGRWWRAGDARGRAGSGGALDGEGHPRSLALVPLRRVVDVGAVLHPGLLRGEERVPDRVAPRCDMIALILSTATVFFDEIGSN